MTRRKAAASTPQDWGESIRDPHENGQRLRKVDAQDARTWTSGADVPLTAPISVMTDKQLGRALAHHKFVFRLPKEWWYNHTTGQYESCIAVADSCVKLNGRFYLNCSIVAPAPTKRSAHVLQFPVGSSRGFHEWHVRRFLDTRFNKPQTLEDLGLEELVGQPGLTASLAAWAYGIASRTITAEDNLFNIGILEPDPKNYKAACRHPILAPFWVESALEEMTGLWRR